MNRIFPASILVLCLTAWHTLHAQADSTDATLLYAREVGGQCSVGVWHSGTSGTSERLRIDACPDTLFVSSDGSRAFIIDAGMILALPLRSDAAADKIPLPDLAYERWAPSADVVMHPANVELLGSTVMQAAGIGFLDDGSPGVHLTLNGPADGSVNYLLRFDGSRWNFIEGRLCGRWEFPCVFDALKMQSSDVWLWPADRQILSPDLSASPYLSADVTPTGQPEAVDNEGEVRKLGFRIDGKNIDLVFDTTPSAHFDHEYTLAIDLVINGQQVANLSRRQCMTSLNGRYLLVREFFGGRYEVTDLGTGETGIGGLGAAIWLD